MKQKIAYIQNIDHISPIAHGVYIAKVCEACSDLGLETFLLTPQKPKSKLRENMDFWDYYRIKKNTITIKQLPNIPQRLLKLFFSDKYFLAESLLLAINSIVYCLGKKIQIIETSEYEVAWLYSLLYPIIKIRVIYDSHIDSPKKIPQFFIRNIHGIVASSQKYYNFFDNLGMHSKLMLIPNGYDPQIFFNIDKGKTIRKTLSISEERFVVGYIGRFETLGVEKGISNLITIGSKAKTKIPLTLLIIGGPQKYINKYQKQVLQYGYKSNECIILPQVSHRDVGKYIGMFDACWLVYPDTDRFRYSMSPLKAIEYMASGRPIIASDFPSITQVLNQRNAYLVKPTDIDSIINQLIEIYKQYPHALEKAQQASVDVLQYTWKLRQKNILQQLKLLN